MSNVRRRIEGAGFFIFMLSLVVVAIGVSLGVTVIWVAGLVIFGLVILTILIRATRAVSGPPRRPQPTDDAKRR